MRLDRKVSEPCLECGSYNVSVIQFKNTYYCKCRHCGRKPGSLTLPTGGAVTEEEREEAIAVVIKAWDIVNKKE